MRIGVEEDGALKLVHGGGELVRAKVRLEVPRLSIARLPCVAAITNPGVRADFVHHSALRRFGRRDGTGQGSVLRIVCL
jgi:hypothetical protein